MLFSIICSFQIFWKNKNDNFDIKINTREQEIKKKRKKRKGESEREGEEEREDKWWEEREKQWGPVIQSMVQLQLDIKSVFSVCESSKNHQSLRFGDWRLGSISNHFPKTFQGLPNIYLFWINVINPPPLSWCHTEEASHSEKITSPLLLIQAARPSQHSGSEISYQQDYIFALAWHVNRPLTVLTNTSANTLQPCSKKKTYCREEYMCDVSVCPFSQPRVSLCTATQTVALSLIDTWILYIFLLLYLETLQLTGV